MSRARLFGLVALFLVAPLAGCGHMSKCSSCSKSASASPAGCTSCPHSTPACASCAAHQAAPIPGPVER